jgi:hypothetical protein
MEGLEPATMVRHAKHVLDTGKSETMLHIVINAKGDEKQYLEILRKMRGDVANELLGKGPLSSFVAEEVKQSGYTRQQLGKALLRKDFQIGVTTWEKLKEATEKAKAAQAAKAAAAVEEAETEALRSSKAAAAETEAAQAANLHNLKQEVEDNMGGAVEYRKRLEDTHDTIPSVDSSGNKLQSGYNKSSDALAGDTGTSSTPAPSQAPAVKPDWVRKAEAEGLQRRQEFIKTHGSY